MNRIRWILLFGFLFGSVSLDMPWVILEIQREPNEQAERMGYYLINDVPIVDGCRLSNENWNTSATLTAYLRSMWVGKILIGAQFVLWLCTLVVYKETYVGISRLAFVLVSTGSLFIAGTILTFAAPHLMSCHEKSEAIVQASQIFLPSLGVSLISICLGFYVLKKFLGTV